MPTYHGAHLSKDDSCPKCGESAIDGWHDSGKIVHEECRDWSLRPYPYLSRKKALQRTRRKLMRIIKAIDRTIAFHDEVARSWPLNAIDALKGYRLRRDWLRTDLSEVAKSDGL